jgi:pimeloyl-ACP methyl ester carboxylesterase
VAGEQMIDRIKISDPQYYLIAGRFGGPAGILLSKDERVKKVLSISAVVDWATPSVDEPLDWLNGYVRAAFGEGYRFLDEDWKKLGSGSFYNPVRQKEKIDGKKILFIHAADDRSVSVDSVISFAKDIGSEIILLKKGGHLSSSIIRSWRLAWKIRRFLCSQ